jgi:hypothetical protein
MQKVLLGSKRSVKQNQTTNRLTFSWISLPTSHGHLITYDRSLVTVKLMSTYFFVNKLHWWVERSTFPMLLLFIWMRNSRAFKLHWNMQGLNKTFVRLSKELQDITRQICPCRFWTHCTNHAQVLVLNVEHRKGSTNNYECCEFHHESPVKARLFASLCEEGWWTQFFTVSIGMTLSRKLWHMFSSWEMNLPVFIWEKAQECTDVC